MNLPTISSAFQSFVAVDEGLDAIMRFDPHSRQNEWTVRLSEKCRSLQILPGRRLLTVCDTGYREMCLDTGSLVTEKRVCREGAISATRLANGHTFIGGLSLSESSGVSFLELDTDDHPVRAVCFGGKYVRRSTPTDAGTILFTCDDHVLEGDWSGRILREFSEPGFQHAWKAVRTSEGTTVISAGYGAFIAEFDACGRIMRRWDCKFNVEEIRPHFFGDFSLLPGGGILVCNWLGHGKTLGSTGYSMLQFAADGALEAVWRDSVRTSSLQTFALVTGPSVFQ